MVAELKPYPEYRDSGVEWLGDVPTHWEVRHLGRIGRFSKGGGGTKEDAIEDGVPCVRYGDLYTHHQFFITASRTCVSPELAATVYTPIHYGDVLFAGSGETIDEIGKSAVNLIRGPACCGGDVIIFRPSIDAEARFLGYVADCSASVHQKACIGRGFTVVHIYSSDLKYVTVPIPPVPEQAAIVRFLDHADRRIRRYIRAKEKLIALLEEQKQAIVHEAVTGRIDVRTGRPYPAYKDSGVAWLGDVPAHWKEVTLGALARSIQTGPFGSQLHASDYVTGGVPVINPAHMTNGSIRPDPTVAVSQQKVEELSMHRLQLSDIVVARRGEVGRCALVAETETGWLCGTGSLRIRLKPGILLPAYLIGLLNAPLLRDALRMYTIGATMDNINAGVVSRLRLALPPSSEQAAVVEYMTHAVENCEAAANTIRHGIEVHGEYRSRLIADVVTGKLDVREAATLPEVDRFAAERHADDGVDHETGSGRNGWGHVVAEGGRSAGAADAERPEVATPGVMTKGR